MSGARTGLIICLLVGGTLMLSGIVTACLWLGVASSLFEAKPPNAQCLVCKHRFNIPEHTGVPAVMQTYACPKCGFRQSASTLYTEAEKVR